MAQEHAPLLGRELDATLGVILGEPSERGMIARRSESPFCVCLANWSDYPHSFIVFIAASASAFDLYSPIILYFASVGLVVMTEQAPF